MSETLHKEQVGRRLRAAIDALGLSQARVAEAFDVSPSKLGNWLRGDNYPSQWFLKQFCDRHGITTDWFYRGIVSGIDAALADKLWQTEHATPLRKPSAPTRPKGPGPPRPPLGGRVKENRFREDCAANVRQLRAGE